MCSSNDRVIRHVMAENAMTRRGTRVRGNDFLDRLRHMVD